MATLTREWGVDPASLVAAIGPSIGPCCYAVGPELRTAFAEAGHPPALTNRWFRDDDTRLVLDLWTANRDLLQQSGVAAEHIHVAALCTQTHREVFESFRADGEQAGRMAALIVAQVLGVADEDLAHRLGGQREEVPAVDERQSLGPHKLEIGLVHERGGVERHRRATEAQLRTRESLELGVEAIEDGVEGAPIPRPHRCEQERDLAGRFLPRSHWRRMIDPVSYTHSDAADE